VKRTLILASLFAVVFLIAAPQARAVKIGVMGDSLSDEYFESSYGSYADNWTVQLVTYGGIDMGPTGAWGGPRRNGYEYNWARSGATSGTLLSAGQHTGLASQIVPDSIDYAVMMIGANDEVEGYPGSSAYEGIMNGTWTSGQINTWVSGVVNNIDTALAAVVPTGVKLVLFGAPDYGMTPTVQNLPTTAAQRQAVHDVLTGQLNPQIEALAQSYNLPYVDFIAAFDAVVGPHNSLNSTLAIGNVDIQLQVTDDTLGSNPYAGFVDDGIHPHTTLQGLLANLVMEGLNVGYGANLTLFTEQEILAHAGIAYGGSDTLEAQIGPYSDYVINYVPEPSSLALAGLAGAALAIAAVRRRKAA
jgi:lysophospholipase L1-like esterase